MDCTLKAAVALCVCVKHTHTHVLDHSDFDQVKRHYPTTPPPTLRAIALLTAAHDYTAWSAHPNVTDG